MTVKASQEANRHSLYVLLGKGTVHTPVQDHDEKILEAHMNEGEHHKRKQHVPEAPEC